MHDEICLIHRPTFECLLHLSAQEVTIPQEPVQHYDSSHFSHEDTSMYFIFPFLGRLTYCQMLGMRTQLSKIAGRLFLRYHPDKGGVADVWHIVEKAIKTAKRFSFGANAWIQYTSVYQLYCTGATDDEMKRQVSDVYDVCNIHDL